MSEDRLIRMANQIATFFEVQPGERAVDGGEILLDDAAALFAIGLFGIGFHVFISLVVGYYFGKFEECSLHDGVDTVTHTHLQR